MKTLTNLYKLFSSERWYPYTLSLVTTLIAFIVFYCFEHSFSLNKGVLSASITFSAILSGFMSTNLVFLATFETRLVKLFKQTPRQWNVLISYFSHGVYWSLPFCVLTLIGLGTTLPSDTHFFFFVWLWLAVLVVLLFHRSLRLLVVLLQSKSHDRR